MKAIDIENQASRSLMNKLMNNKIVSYEMKYMDCISFDQRCVDGYKIQNRMVRVFDLSTVISEIRDYLDTYVVGKYGGRRLNRTKHEELLAYLLELHILGEDNDLI